MNKQQQKWLVSALIIAINLIFVISFVHTWSGLVLYLLSACAGWFLGKLLNTQSDK